jgi:hypothetical protein
LSGEVKEKSIREGRSGKKLKRKERTHSIESCTEHEIIHLSGNNG